MLRDGLNAVFFAWQGNSTSWTVAEARRLTGTGLLPLRALHRGMGLRVRVPPRMEPRVAPLI